VATSIVTFRMEDAMKDTLDTLARRMDRDRSYLLNEAVAAYLAAHRWQVEHIEEGARQAAAGEFATDAEVTAVFARWRK
jgi:predicted transcriptional regulator